MNTISQHILSVVETKREQLGMSKAELARRMDINPVTLGTMLRGTRAMYADEAIKLCAYLDIAPAEFMTPELRKKHSEYWGRRVIGQHRPDASMHSGLAHAPRHIEFDHIGGEL